MRRRVSARLVRVGFAQVGTFGKAFRPDSDNYQYGRWEVIELVKTG